MNYNCIGPTGLYCHANDAKTVRAVDLQTFHLNVFILKLEIAFGISVRLEGAISAIKLNNCFA